VQGTASSVIISAAALLMLTLVGGLGVVILQRLQPHPDGYLGTSSTAVDFIQWTEDTNHYLSGTIQGVSATANNTTKSDSAAFIGVHNGSSISLTETGPFFPWRMTRGRMALAPCRIRTCQAE
jgi:hypothetical protein